MIGAVATLLRADAQFMSGLAGGLHDAADEISRQTTPAAFDANVQLLPCGLLKAGTLTGFGPVGRGARQVFRLFLYQRGGRTIIDPARRRAYALLHEQTVTLDAGEGRCYEIAHLDDVLDAPDEALRSALIVSRFAAVLMR